MSTSYDGDSGLSPELFDLVDVRPIHLELLDTESPAPPSEETGQELRRSIVARLLADAGTEASDYVWSYDVGRGAE